MDLLSDLAGPVITGGAWGTELQAQGLVVDGCADLWNLTRPAIVEQVAAAYAEAGSCIVLTNTFQANRIALDRHGLATEVGRINRLGVTLVRRGVDHRALVFGSMGPTGQASKIEMEAAFLEQAESLAEANAYGIVIETMTNLEEARIALKAALTTGLQIIVSLTPTANRRGLEMSDGQSVVSSLQILIDEGASHVGLNCVDLDTTAAACGELQEKLQTALWLKPNAGLPIIVDGAPRYGLTPVEFASVGARLVKRGAFYIGGCCGVGPAHIAALHSELKKSSAA